MPTPLVTALLLVLGLALCVGGFLFFKEAFYLLGFLAGLSVGLVALDSVALPGQWGLAILIAAPVVGLLLAAWIRTMAIAVIGAFIGGAVGIIVTGVSLTPITNLANPVLGACVVVGIIGAFFAETAILMFASASWGAALLSLGLGVPLVDSGTSIQSGLANLLPTTFWALFGFGLAVQIGVWYYLRTRLDADESLKGVLFRRAGRQLGSLRN